MITIDTKRTNNESTLLFTALTDNFSWNFFTPEIFLIRFYSDEY